MLIVVLTTLVGVWCAKGRHHFPMVDCSFGWLIDYRTIRDPSSSSLGHKVGIAEENNRKHLQIEMRDTR